MEDQWKMLLHGEKIAEKMGKDPCLVSDTILEVYEACSSSWNESQGSFKTYFAFCLRRKLAKLRRLQIPPEEIKTFGHSTLDSLIKEEGIVDPLAIARRVLDEDELAVLHERYALGQTLWEIGARRGITKNAMWARLQKILDKLRDEVR